jgi:hypothetical protein
MEIYGGELFKAKYHLNGLLNTPRIESWIKQIYIFSHRNFNILSIMCLRFKLFEQSDIILAKRREFEVFAPDFGLTFNSMVMSKALSKIKNGKPII